MFCVYMVPFSASIRRIAALFIFPCVSERIWVLRESGAACDRRMCQYQPPDFFGTGSKEQVGTCFKGCAGGTYVINNKNFTIKKELGCNLLLIMEYPLEIYATILCFQRH